MTNYKLIYVHHPNATSSNNNSDRSVKWKSGKELSVRKFHCGILEYTLKDHDKTVITASFCFQVNVKSLCNL